MCRLVAYCGPEIPLERLIVLPQHSLIEQSQAASEAKLAVNGDGFGLAWYGRDAAPGLYRDVLPAWSDSNLPSLCRMIRAKLFLAHVRASTTGGTARANCHPFTYKNWSFAHNGQLAAFSKIRRQLEAMLPDALFELRNGTTDSELIFLLAIANGLTSNPEKALNKTFATIKAIQGPTKHPNRGAYVLCDGQSVYGMRHSSDAKSPSLYVGTHLTSGGSAFASEPLDADPTAWSEMEEGKFYTLKTPAPRTDSPINKEFTSENLPQILPRDRLLLPTV